MCIHRSLFVDTLYYLRRVYFEYPGVCWHEHPAVTAEPFAMRIFFTGISDMAQQVQVLYHNGYAGNALPEFDQWLGSIPGENTVLRLPDDSRSWCDVLNLSARHFARQLGFGMDKCPSDRPSGDGLYNGNGMAETPVDIGMAGAPFSNGVADASLNNGAAHASVNGVADAPFHNGVANALVPDRESQPSGSANGSLDGVADAPFNGGVAGAPFHGVADADGPFHNGVADAPADGVGADAPDPVTNPSRECVSVARLVKIKAL
ncbi:hypothetical protein B0T25DRAFT_568977 [Lasiosphaeria hispida]|uniref:Uncharacterized protein n=1 Tax=Lasiosphaeria hispida TaxID=260671 RepID=A0AAJ0HJD0_9PEZI|nr:hypothetical protein B0T25DRAFT_568977 [Lasiosphaeria hispida]